MTEIEKSCPCKRVKCERHGQCEKCREHHATKKHSPVCERIKKSKKLLRKK